MISFLLPGLSRFTVVLVVTVMMRHIYFFLAVACTALAPLTSQILPPITVGVNTAPAPGALYIAPHGKTPNALFSPSLMVVGNDGRVVTSRFLPEYALDFRILPDGRLGHSVFLAPNGVRQSSDIVLSDTLLNPLDTVKGANGYATAMHTFATLPNGHRLLVMQEDVIVDMSTEVPGGHPAATVQQSILQELDVRGNIIFQWRSLDHFPVTVTNEDITAPSIRYFLMNSVVVDTDGNFLISARNASLVAKIHRRTGKVLWVLGGKLNQFVFSAEPGLTDDPLFSYQHDVLRTQKGTITMFDNGSLRSPAWSRAAEYSIDETAKTCRLIWQYRKTPDLYADNYGSVQTHETGNRIISWGSALQNNKTVITEIDVKNKEVYEINLPGTMLPYRAVRAPYPTGRHQADVLIDEILPTNTYTYTKGPDTVGLTITYHTLISFFYNTTTARRYMWAPEDPSFERIVDGKQTPTLAPYVVYPCRVTLTQEGMVDHAGEFRFSVTSLGITDPANTVVYYRDSIGKRSFRPLPTRYNPNTRELVVDTARTGEFCFGCPVKDDADSIASPVLLWPTAKQPVLEKSSFVLHVAPRGQTQYVSYELQNPLGTKLLSSTDKQTDREVAPGLAPGEYYWRARSRYGNSISEWTPLDTFVVEGPFLTINRPTTSAVWYHDSSYVVTWNTNITTPIKIELLKDNTVVTMVRENLPAQQRGFLWNVPTSVPVGTGYRLRVTPMDTSLDSLVQETPFSIEIRGVPSSIQDEINTSIIALGPNPASTVLFVGGQTPITRILLFAVDGAMVIDRNVQGTGEILDLSHLAQGSYVLRCETPHGPIQKIVVVAR